TDFAAEKDDTVRVRIIGKAGLTPETTPSPEEREAIRRLEGHESLLLKGGDGSFTYYFPLTNRETCATCHLERGQKEGEILGAVSVSFLPEYLRERFRGEITSHAVNVLSVWLIGLLFIAIGKRTLTKSFREAFMREQEFRSFFEQSADPVFMTTLEGDFLDANDAFLNLFGYAREDLETLNARDLYADPSDRETYLKTLLEEGKITEYPLRMKKRWGDELTCIVSASLKRDVDGKPVGIQGIIRDETEKESLIQRLSYLETCINQSTDIIIVTDPSGTIQFVNPAFEKVTGYSREEALGETPRILKSGVHDEEFYRNLWETITKGESWRGRFTNRRKNGETYLEDAVISPVTDEAGNITGFVAVKRDVTEQVQVEKRVEAAQRMEAIGRLAGTLAHDLNNYLGAALGFAELGRKKLGEGRPAEEVTANLDQIVSTIERSKDLLQKILAFSRKQPAEPKVIDVNREIETISAMLKRLMGEKIRLDLFLKEGLWRTKIDPAQLEQVVTNLVINARDAMPEGGVITIETENVELDEQYVKTHPIVEKTGRYVLLSVADTGRGIPEEIREKIFEPFFTTKPEGEGTGLGLSTVYGIVKQNGGYIWVYSEVGKGTTFKVYLPATEEPLSEEAGREREEALAKGKGELVLVVEDNDDIREAITGLLETAGYRVISAPDGETALLNYPEEVKKINLLLTDVVLPKTSGKEVADLVRGVNPGVKVLFMSGYTENIIAHEGLIQEGLHFISKPFSAASLWKKVREVLDS
ncbi:MAG: PAS domain S-box protein, partial [Deltaproteobacteria bacterium]